MLYCKIKKDKKKRHSEWINMATFAQHPPPPYPAMHLAACNTDGRGVLLEVTDVPLTPGQGWDMTT